jgi:hypothetical protein
MNIMYLIILNFKKNLELTILTLKTFGHLILSLLVMLHCNDNNKMLYIYIYIYIGK